MRKKIIIILLVIFIAVTARFLFGLFSIKKHVNTTVPVTVSYVEETNQNQKFEVPARVVAKSQIEINARISGYLTKSYFKEGDYVEAGQVLFEIEPQEYELAVQKAKAEVIRVKAQQIYFDKQANRYQQLVKKDYVAKADYDNAIAQRDAYRAQTAYAEMAYRDAIRNLSYTKVKAPVSGRVGIIDVTVGNYVTINSGALTTLYSTKPMYVTFPLEMSQYNLLTAIDGQNASRKVEYIYSNGTKYSKSGIQNFSDNKVDESTGTIKMRATFDNSDNGLYVGDFGKIIIYSNNKTNIPKVLSKCIQENQEGKYVYLLDKNNLPRLTYIKTIEQQDEYTYVSEGLKAGDLIITSGIQKVINGVPVKIVSKEIDSNTTNLNIFQKIFNKIFKHNKDKV